MNLIFRRYFPKSFKLWEQLNLPNHPIKLFKYYLDAEYKDDLQILNPLFLNFDNLYIALLKTKNFRSFLEYKQIKFFKVKDLDKLLDELFIEYEKEHPKPLAFTIFFEFPGLFLNQYLVKRKYPPEKLVTVRLYRNSKFILSSNTLMVDEAGYQYLIDLYKKLKKVI